MTTRRYRITIGGRSYDVEVGDIAHSPVTVTVDGVSYEVEVSGQSGSTPSATPSQAPARPASLRPAAPPRPATPASTGGRDVRAMMPGRVLNVSVKPGDSVSRGQALMVIESMKMENTVASPRDGIVRAVLVSEGAAVQHGQSLVEFE